MGTARHILARPHLSGPGPGNRASIPHPWPAFPTVTKALPRSSQSPFGINHYQCDPFPFCSPPAPFASPASSCLILCLFWEPSLGPPVGPDLNLCLLPTPTRQPAWEPGNGLCGVLGGTAPRWAGCSSRGKAGLGPVPSSPEWVARGCTYMTVPGHLDPHPHCRYSAFT